MPTVKPGESKEDWMKRCVPIVISEGTAKDNVQATAICSSMFGKGDKKDISEFPVEVMSTGVWNGHKFTLDDLVEISSNFQRLKDVIKPPVKLGHTPDKPGAPAYGWVTNLKVVGNKLMAILSDLPEMLLKAIRAKRYRRVSSEIFFEYKYGGKDYGKVFSGLALLGAETPAVKDLKDLQAYLTQNSDIGTFEKIEAFDSPSDFESFNLDKENIDMEPKKLEEELRKFQDQLTTLTAQNTKLQTDLDKANNEKKALEVKQFEDKKNQNIAELKAFCDTHVKEGRMLPAQRDALVKDEKAVCFDDEGSVVINFDTFKKHIEMADKVVDKKEHAEDGGSDTKFDSVQSEIDVKVAKYMADKNEKDYKTAFDAVLTLDSDLANRYIKDTAPNY